MTEQDECITIQLEITAYDCIHALSHLTVEVPCGTVSSASNSGGWPMELNSTDPTSGVYGIKVDDIQNIGEGSEKNSFIVEYTICSSDTNCLNQIKSSSFQVVYKAATCIFIDVIEPEDSNLSAYLTTRDLLCHGANDGEIITTITEGQEPFTYYWSNGAQTKDLNNILAGSYQLTIIDGSGKSLTLSSQINEPEAISAQASIQHANCGSNDGSIAVSVVGGSEPYTYLWDTGETDNSIDLLSGGLYTLTITDANACSKTVKYTIQNLTTLQASVSTDVIECHEDGQGTLEVTVSEGNEPYTYLWDNGDTSSIATNLTSGSHKVIITDASGCSIEKTAYVIMNKLTATATTTDPVCNGEADGSVEITINNGTAPYSISWNTGDTTTIINDLNAGWYWADIIDANGCTFRKYVNIKEPAEINLTSTQTRGSCDESDSTIIVHLSATGGTPPYIYYMDDIESDPTFTVEKTGYYTFRITDTNGCENIDSILVTRPEAKLNTNINIIQPDCSNPDFGFASINIYEGAKPYVIVWSDGSESISRNDLAPGQYQVTISDAAGCTSEHDLTINEIQLSSAEIIAPDIMPDCYSNNNLLFAFSNNADSFEWSISDADTQWIIESQQADQLNYSAGQNSALISLMVTSADGCVDRDTIMLSCVGSENENPTDSISDGGCNTCYEFIPTHLEKLDDNCYKYTATVISDGSCRYDLSHLSLEVLHGRVHSAGNSKGWQTEINSTDPTTGLFGIKVDDISNFGKTIDQFNIEYTICFEQDLQRDFAIAYKSAQCVVRDTVRFGQQIAYSTLSSNSYPNPFAESTQIEFTAKTSSNAELCIYDIYGNLVECLYNGPVEANTYYSFEFRPLQSNENLFFYRLVCGNEVSQGKLMKVR